MNSMFLLSGIGIIAVAIVSVLYWKIHSKVALIFFILGALSWILGIITKLIASIPNAFIRNIVRESLPDYFSEPVLWIYIGLLTGIFECGAALIFANINKIKSSNRNEVIGFGIGFGSIEAFLTGIISFFAVLLVITIPDKLPQQFLEYVTSGSNSLLVIPAPIIERINAIFIHTFSCFLIIYAVRMKEWKWFWISFIYKTAVDSTAGFINLSYDVNNFTTTEAWLTELAFLPFGIIGAWGLCLFYNHWGKNIADE